MICLCIVSTDEIAARQVPLFPGIVFVLFSASLYNLATDIQDDVDECQCDMVIDVGTSGI